MNKYFEVTVEVVVATLKNGKEKKNKEIYLVDAQSVTEAEARVVKDFEKSGVQIDYKVSGAKENSQPVKPITYSVIKSGLVGMTKYLATYWSANGVRVNALSPGGIYEEQNADFVKKISDLIPLGRMAKSNEYRSAVQFLCSDASSYMTGQNIVIDGGRSVW